MPSKNISTEYSVFEEQKLACRACPVYSCYKCIVPSEGNKNNPVVVIIGEAPGADEIEENRPFIGRAGQFLRQHLRELGFNTKNTLITNTIPCRPQNNKFPDNLQGGKENVEKCVGLWVKRELSILAPKFAILLGRKALDYVAGNPRWQGITRQRGKTLKMVIGDHKVITMPTFHPSYVLRKKNMKDGEQIVSDFVSDLKSIASAMKKVSPQNN